MGRGRQKAKQTKVARKLKYFSPETDYAQLERELQGASVASSRHEDSDDSDYDDYDDYEIPSATGDDEGDWDRGWR